MVALRREEGEGEGEVTGADKGEVNWGIEGLN
jgi:hypothetical protein